jgi:carbamoyltransferase
VNERIKFRESFRPFAPTILKEYHEEYYDAEWKLPSQFMLLAQEVDSSKRDELPAVVHVNDTSRLQTVTREQNSRYYTIIEEFRQRTGVPVVLNTSFNLSGEPIVETPIDALSTFLRSGLDYLVLEGYIVKKRQTSDGSQPPDYREGV